MAFPQFDFVHLDGITDSVNQALKKSEGDFDYLAYWLPIEITPAVSDALKPVAPPGLRCEVN